MRLGVSVDGLTPLGNPFTAGANGYAAFHATGGAYRVTASKGPFSRTWRYVGIGAAAEFDVASGIAQSRQSMPVLQVASDATASSRCLDKVKMSLISLGVSLLLTGASHRPVSSSARLYSDIRAWRYISARWN